MNKFENNEPFITPNLHTTSFLGGVAFMVVVMLFMQNGGSHLKTSFEREPVLMTVAMKEEPFTKERFREYLTEAGVKFPDIVYAQAVLESGFNSPAFLERNNPFGMGPAQTRNTTSKNREGAIANYDHWKFAIQDQALYQAAFLREIETEDQYLAYIGKYYAKDPDYVSKIKSILKQVRNEK